MPKKVKLPTEEEIRVKAYQIYLARGCQPGHPTDDWLQAEYELIHLPLHKLAELDAVVVQKKIPQYHKLFILTRAALNLRWHPVWSSTRWCRYRVHLSCTTVGCQPVESLIHHL